MGIQLTVTAKGQVTLRREVLEHMGIGPGDRLEVDLLPGGRVQVSPRRGGPIGSLFGMLRRPGQRVATLEQIEAAAARGWSGER
jgi:AbrB family looped-hinge helix DNA binding protein